MSPADKSTVQHNVPLSKRASSVVSNAQIQRVMNGPEVVGGLANNTELITRAGETLARRLERRHNSGKHLPPPAANTKLPKGTRAGVLRDETDKLVNTTLLLPAELVDRVRGLLALFAYDPDARAKEGIGSNAEFWTAAVLEFAKAHQKKTGVDLTEDPRKSR